LDKNAVVTAGAGTLVYCVLVVAAAASTVRIYLFCKYRLKKSSAKFLKKLFAIIDNALAFLVRYLMIPFVLAYRRLYPKVPDYYENLKSFNYRQKMGRSSKAWKTDVHFGPTAILSGHVMLQSGGNKLSILKLSKYGHSMKPRMHPRKLRFNPQVAVKMIPMFHEPFMADNHGFDLILKNSPINEAEVSAEDAKMVEWQNKFSDQVLPMVKVSGTVFLYTKKKILPHVRHFPAKLAWIRCKKQNPTLYTVKKVPKRTRKHIVYKGFSKRTEELQNMKKRLASADVKTITLPFKVPELEEPVVVNNFPSLASLRKDAAERAAMAKIVMKVKSTLQVPSSVSLDAYKLTMKVLPSISSGAELLTPPVLRPFELAKMKKRQVSFMANACQSDQPQAKRRKLANGKVAEPEVPVEVFFMLWKKQMKTILLLVRYRYFVPQSCKTFNRGPNPFALAALVEGLKKTIFAALEAMFELKKKKCLVSSSHVLLLKNEPHFVKPLIFKAIVISPAMALSFLALPTNISLGPQLKLMDKPYHEVEIMKRNTPLLLANEAFYGFYKTKHDFKVIATELLVPMAVAYADDDHIDFNAGGDDRNDKDAENFPQPVSPVLVQQAPAGVIPAPVSVQQAPVGLDLGTQWVDGNRRSARLVSKQFGTIYVDGLRKSARLC
jgi:hypothetical protein